MHRGEVRVSAIDHHYRGDGAEISLAECRGQRGRRGDGLFGELDLCFVHSSFFVENLGSGVLTLTNVGG